MPRIAIVIPTIEEIGGAERQVLLLATEFAKAGYAVTVVALSGGAGVARQELLEAGVTLLALEMRKAWIDPRGWWRYLVWARRERPEIVHAHLPHATWFARWMRLVSPVRVLIDTIHTSNAGGTGRQIGYRLSDWLTDQVTCVSGAVAEVTASQRVAKCVRILPNGVVVPEAQVRDATADVFHWIAVGRLSRVKDYPTLLRAFARLPTTATLTIAGSGPDEGGLRELATDLEIEGRVFFSGFQAEVHRLLVRADGFVLASLWEGLPISVLEAQAAGLPVVATDGRGTREAMIDGESGLIVPVGDVDGLAAAMAAVMMMSREQRIAMGSRGRELILAKFSLSAVVERWQMLFARLLANNPKARRWGRRGEETRGL